MKNKSILKLTGILLTFLLLFSGCAKETDEPQEDPNTPGTSAKFSWKINSGASVSANDYYFIPAYNNIVGGRNDGSNVDIVLDALTKGTYNISPSSGITLEYSDGTVTYTGKSGSVIITENTGTLLSGTFNCSLSGGGTTSTIQGEFSNVPKK